MPKVSTQTVGNKSANVYSAYRTPSKRRQLKLIRQYRTGPEYDYCDPLVYEAIQRFYEQLRRDRHVPTLAKRGATIKDLVSRLVDPAIDTFFHRLNRSHKKPAFSNLIGAPASNISNCLEIMWPRLQRKLISSIDQSSSVQSTDEAERFFIEHTCFALRRVLDFASEFPPKSGDHVVVTDDEWAVIRSSEYRSDSYRRENELPVHLRFLNIGSRYCIFCGSLTESEVERNRLLSSINRLNIDSKTATALRRGFPLKVNRGSKSSMQLSYQLCAMHSKSGSGDAGYMDGYRSQQHFLALLRLMGHSCIQISWLSKDMACDLRDVANDLYAEARQLPAMNKLIAVVTQLYSPYPGTREARIEAQQLMQEILEGVAMAAIPH